VFIYLDAVLIYSICSVFYPIWYLSVWISEAWSRVDRTFIDVYHSTCDTLLHTLFYSQGAKRESRPHRCRHSSIADTEAEKGRAHIEWSNMHSGRCFTIELRIVRFR
jgi:hypothetical protein